MQSFCCPLVYQIYFCFKMMLKRNVKMLTGLVLLVSTTLFASYGACENGYIRNQIFQTKFVCSASNRKTYKVTSEMQCAHRCLRQENCGILNYKEQIANKGHEDNCEIYSLHSTHSSCSMHSGENKWKALVFEKQKRKVYKSCKEIFANTENPATGVYELQDGKHFCRMDNITGCGTGGWTLAMKINGSKATFTANADYWTNNITYNTVNGLKSFESGEAKFPAFSTVPLDAICVGMIHSGRTNWLRISISSSSLKDVFKGGTHVPTNVNRATWKSLIGAEASLQLNCNRQGFNVYTSTNVLLCRVGYIANQENDCASPDSFIGFGTTDRVLCGALLPSISCGNFALCGPDNGIKSLPRMGFILIK